jgi:hypothetical protein
MIRICFRLDDPSAASNHDLERRLLEVFARNSTPLCAAVVPFKRKGGSVVSVRPDNVPHLVEAQEKRLLEIAQHGHAHIPRGGKTADGRHSEFAGVSLEEQRRLITDGRQRLLATFKQPISGFVPPWNTFDRNTVHAVADTGFDYLSAGVRDRSFEPARLAALPKTAKLKHLTRETLGTLRRFTLLSPLVVVVFHGYDIVESGSKEAHLSLHDLDRLLAWLQDDPDIEAIHLKDAVGFDPHPASFWRPTDVSLLRFLPNRMRTWIPRNAVFPGVSPAASAFNRLTAMVRNNKG